MPRQYNHHRAEFDLVGATSHIGKELENVRHHRVWREVVLDAPDGVESQRLGKIGKVEIILIDLIVRPLVAGVLHENRHPNFHNDPPY